ncbi:MAG: protein translocase subunit SecF [Spirochaetales bacterium]|nr:protein translocase subunit SecF [Spirochaetales bacterium]
MKRLIKFHKAFLPATLVSVALLAFSVLGLFVKGFNLGVDFQAGINQYVRLAYPTGTVTYSGPGTPRLEINDDTAAVVFTGTESSDRTASWDLATVGTLADLAAAMKAEGVDVSLSDGAGYSAELLLPTFQGDYILSAQPTMIHRMPRGADERLGSVEEIRQALTGLGNVTVQAVGAEGSGEFIVRVRDDGTDKNFSAKVPEQITLALDGVFGAGRTVAVKTDYVGPRFSQSLAQNVVWLTLLTLGGILLYAGIRFKFQFATGAVLAVVHDGLIMAGFMIWTGMEFGTTSIAAILTILGYSINDTIVIFDRIREDHKLSPTDSMTTIIDRSISETLGRTVITTVTTLLAVLALFLFTTGSIKDFALALIVGIISGTYSTIFIASGFVAWWDKMRVSRHAKLNAGTEVQAH